jgi:hypothetical protein
MAENWVQGGAGMATEKVNVIIADDYRKRFAAVVRQCIKAGLKVEQELKEVGVVSGFIASTKLAALDRVKGVAAVERERAFQLSPPDSNIQSTAE